MICPGEIWEEYIHDEIISYYMRHALCNLVVVVSFTADSKDQVQKRMHGTCTALR